MPARRLTLPAVATLALACVVLGVLAALADGEGPAKRARAVHATAPAPAAAARPAAARPAVRALTPASVPVVRVAAPSAVPFVVDAGLCGPGAATPKPPAAQAVPQNLLDAFGVLRRERAAGDALPAAALKALRARGLEPFDPAAARLLRTTAAGGRAWVVPVRDARTPALPFVRCSVLPGAARPRVLRLKAPRRTPPTIVPSTPAPYPGPVPSAPTPPRATADDPRPGLAVVAVDGAPAGAGGPLEDLVRGREPVATDVCAGPDKDMMSISGLVPDGVPAAFLTSPDGTAVRADVKDNAYTFTIPPAKTFAQRYVVWTGGDGTPHVQPVPARPFAIPAARCASLHRGPTISPDPFAAWPLALPAAPFPRARPSHRHG
jgi:hypothetical protein